MLYQDLPAGPKRMVQRWGVALIVLLNVLVVALIASYGVAAWKDFEAVDAGDELRIPISGEGKVSAKPDVARFYVSIVSRGQGLQPTQEENSQKSNTIVAYLKGEGVADADIRSTGYFIYPQYRYPAPCPPYLSSYTPEEYARICPVERQVQTIIGYEVRSSYEVTARDIGKAGALLSGVVGAGANEVGNLVFTIDKPDALAAEARAKAIANAREKAEALADELDKRMGRLVSFTEGGYYPPVYFEGYGKGGDAVGSAAPPSIQPGENEIRITVSAVYEFE
ncbi:DUF541 domain-containing protein [Candidatus Parcubacteria bacterium]|nr:MAG: DUF541 domain-containing protein [Candidatus Parcubacteria bacterium]